MDKKNYWVVAIIITVVLLFTLKGINLTFNPITFISFDSQGKFSVQRTCAEVSETHTEGASEGECFEYYLSNVLQNVRYIASMTEKVSSSGTITCTVDTDVVSSSTVSKCNGQAWHNGATEQTCSSGTECTSGVCNNLLCKQGLPNECNALGDYRCSDSTHRQKCQGVAQLKWSGLLACQQNSVCYDACSNLNPDGGCAICKITSTSSSSSSGGTQCTSKSCSQLNAECGSISDGCGNTIACGSCTSGKSCSNNKCVTTTTSCDADTCSSLDLECGAWNDGCGGTINCGSCTSDKVCELGLCVKTEDVTNPDDVVDDSDNVVDGNVDDGTVIPTEDTVSQFDFNKTLFNIGDFEVKLWMLIVAIILLIVILAVVK